MSYINSLGRRKTSVARVYLKAGSGNISINGRSIENYFPQPSMQMVVNQPLTLTETAGQFDMKINVFGGGYKGQAEAIRLGISRALLKVDEEHRVALKPKVFLPEIQEWLNVRNPVRRKPVRASSSASVNQLFNKQNVTSNFRSVARCRCTFWSLKK